MKPISKLLIWTSLFAIAMGFLESSVVIYLRELFYPNGFQFPLKPVPAFIAKVEFFRELATIVMLIACGIFAGRTRLESFAYFIFAFAVWDLFYYLFLYICLAWPASITTWDILFLIPVPWVGPVWAPCILCVLMIIGACYVIRQTDRDLKFSIALINWWLMIFGAFVCMVSFMWDYLYYTYHKTNSWSVFSSNDLFSEIENYRPQHFITPLFFTGFLLMTVSLVLSILKPIKK